MTTEQTTEKIETSDAPQSSPQTPLSEKSTTISSSIDSTTTVTTTNVKHQSITTTTDTTTGTSLVISALSHDMLELKIHIHEILFAVLVFALCLVCQMLPVSVDCSFLIVPSIFSNVYFLLFDMVDVPW